jgi:hypothetical protein
MKVVITGGSGLIGRALTNLLVKDGYKVVILSRNPENVRGLPNGANAIRWDGKTGDGWEDYIEGATAVVNLAGASIADDNPLKIRWTADKKKAIVDSRVDAGRAMIDAFSRATRKPKVLIQSSAVGYYGPVAGDRMITEEDRSGFDFLAQVCVKWEKVTDPILNMGVRRAIIRTGVVLSNEGGAFPLMMLPVKMFVGGPIGSGKQYVPWIHIMDEARAIKFLIENENARGAYNLSAPNPVPNKALIQAAGKQLNRPTFVPTPAFVFQLAFGEASTILLDGQCAVPKNLQDAGFQFEYPTIESAMRDLLG